MLEQSFGCGLVVIRRNREKAVGARGAHAASRFDDFVRVVAAGAGQHRHASARLAHDQFDDAHLLLVGERRHFPGRAARNQEMDTGVNLPLREPRHTRFIERAVAPEGRDQRGAATGKGCSHEWLLR
jgi:predicted protein tyrosine phosphatase